MLVICCLLNSSTANGHNHLRCTLLDKCVLQQNRIEGLVHLDPGQYLIYMVFYWFLQQNNDVYIKVVSLVYSWFLIIVAAFTPKKSSVMKISTIGDRDLFLLQITEKLFYVVFVFRLHTLLAITRATKTRHNKRN